MREQIELLASLDRRIKALEQLETKGTSDDLYAGDGRFNGGIVAGGQAYNPPDGTITMKEASEPATPPTGYCIIWYNSSNELWVKTDGGVSTQLA